MIYVALFLLSFVLTYFIKNYAIKNSLVAEINERSSHSVPTPHGGGIAIAVTWFVGLSYLFFRDDIESSLYYALMVGIILAIVSYLDDLYELSSKIRLLTQGLVAVLGLYFLSGMHNLDMFLFTINNQFVTNIFAFLLIVWFINLTNFLDGINGYASGEFLFLSIAGFLLYGENYFLVLAVAILGFTYWNWNKAKIFMGDVGSTLLGYNIAIITIYYANMNSLDLWIWITLFSLFWFDATVTLVRRKLKGVTLTQAHKKHAYQRLTQSGWKHYKVSSYAIAINILLFLCIYLTENIILSFIFSLVLLSIILIYIERKKSFYES